MKKNVAFLPAVKMYKVYKQRQTGLKVQGGRSKRRGREIGDPRPLSLTDTSRQPAPSGGRSPGPHRCGTKHRGQQDRRCLQTKTHSFYSYRPFSIQPCASMHGIMTGTTRREEEWNTRWC